MKAHTKSVFLLLATLAVGLLVGAVATGAAMNYRLDELQSLRRPGGFTERMVEIIQPRDAAQRAEIDIILERAHTRFHEARRECGTRYTAASDAMRAELASVLTPEQQARLDAWLERGRRDDRRRKPSDKAAPHGMK